ncbi:MAG: excisionase family DNA-binding protein [Dehalococcoidia bacterium]
MISVGHQEALLLSVSEAAQLLGIGRSKTYELVATGELATVRIGRSVRVPRAIVEGYVERLIEQSHE